MVYYTMENTKGYSDNKFQTFMHERKLNVQTQHDLAAGLVNISLHFVKNNSVFQSYLINLLLSQLLF